MIVGIYYKLRTIWIKIYVASCGPWHVNAPLNKAYTLHNRAGTVARLLVLYLEVT